jgi:hypothetical protein
MNSFESIVAGLFRAEGFWTAIGYRVELTKEQKRKIGKPSLARPEIDILAYKGKENQLIWIECKSYLDSPGVRYKHFTNSSDSGFQRFKVFNDPPYRRVISQALIDQATESGLTRPKPKLKYCLVAGKAGTDSDKRKIADMFIKKGWVFHDIDWIREQLKKLATSRYEDDITMMLAKIIQK